MPRTAGPPAPPALTSEMNVTPMIDVLLVVLIIYMVLTMWRHVLPVGTPPASPPGARAETLQLVLRIDAGGSLFLNGQAVPAAALDAQLRSVYRDRPAKLLFVAADPAVPYHLVISAMDRARGAGVEVLAFMPAPPR